MKRLNSLLALIAVVLGLCILQACDKPAGGTGAAGAPASTFRILAGSELKDVADMVTAYGKTRNVNVIFEYTGTLDAVDRLSDKHNFDAVWVSHGKYLQLVPAVGSQIKSSEKTMYSRVVLGVKPEVARALGWQSGKTGWLDVLAAVRAGKFHFAMTNPTGSNTAFVALVGLAAELSGKGDALEEKDIPADKLKELFKGQTMSAGSSGVLADMFVASPALVDGIINYESVIRSMAAKGTPLEVIIPREGVITADYPLILLNASPGGTFYAGLVAWLRSDAIQQQIAAATFRTPLSGAGNKEMVNELPFPGSLRVVDAILKGFLNSYSKPASSYFVLDVSGSMAYGGRLDMLKQAMSTLAGGDATAAGRFSTFRGREHIEMTPFSDIIYPTTSYDLSEDTDANRPVLLRIAGDIAALQPGGGTAIFDSIARVYPKAQAAMAKGERSATIVLLTDGENTNGMELDAFREWVSRQGAPRVPVFTIVYGDAKQSEMDALAKATGGRMFDARNVKLARVMKDIRTYQ